MRNAEQGELFDLEKGLARKRDALESVEEARPDALLFARKACVAAAMGRESMTATADDAYRAMVVAGYDIASFGASAGAIFRDGHWRKTGQWCASARASNNGREIRVWRLETFPAWVVEDFKRLREELEVELGIRLT